MVFEDRAHRWSGKVSLAVATAVAAVALGACATGLEPDRSGLTSGGASSTAGGGGTGLTGPAGGAGGVGGASTTTTSSSSGTTSDTTTSSSSGTTTSDTTTSSSSGTTTSTETGPPPDGVYVQYKTTISAATTNQLKAVFNLVNGSPDPVTLAAVTIRYHYTIDGELAQEFHCDYAMLGCGVVTGAFMTESGTNADHYLEVGFAAAAGTLAPGAQSGEIQARWNKTNFANFDQSNDYSFDGALVDFTTVDKVTVYYNGALVWGIEP